MMEREQLAAANRSAFPCGFVCGVSTSSYQNEGAAREDGRGPSVWDGFCRIPGKIANGDTGDTACNHYHRYAENVELMRQIGVSAYRFSVTWPRVLPAGTGAVNATGVAFYDRLIDRLLAARIEPWLCLYHWDLPQALQDLGGWANREIVDWYADYARLIARRFGDRVKHFATFNEPSVFSLFSYAFGWHPPASSDRTNHFKAIHHINLAHGAGVDALREHVKDALIGCVNNIQPSRAVAPTATDAAAARLLDEYWNKAFPDPQILGRYPPALTRLIEPYQRDGDLARICRPVDWLGVNHYSPIYAKAAPESALGFAWADAPPDVPRSPIGWQIDPDAFRDTLLEALARYALPIFVTENGAGSSEKLDDGGQVLDYERIGYFKLYANSMREAIARGADVRGYFVWSLLDNFEWGAGYANRFGLVFVDYPTQRRVLKASARWYRQLIDQESALATVAA